MSRIGYVLSGYSQVNKQQAEGWNSGAVALLGNTLQQPIALH